MYIYTLSVATFSNLLLAIRGSCITRISIATRSVDMIHSDTDTETREVVHGDFIGVPLDREPGDLINDSKRSFFFFFFFFLSFEISVDLINMRAYLRFQTLKSKEQ